MKIISMIEKYGIKRLIILSFSFLYYRLKTLFLLYYPNVIIMIKKRLVIGEKCIASQKVYVTGKGKISIGNKVQFGYNMGGYYRYGCIEIQARDFDSEVILGNSISANNNLLIISKKKVVIGDECLIGHNCEFIDSDGHGIHPHERKTTSGGTEPIIIGRNVWFGVNCIILKGTEIGDNCIVAAGSVVKGKFGDNLIIGGIPAKEIRQIILKE